MVVFASNGSFALDIILLLRLLHSFVYNSRRLILTYRNLSDSKLFPTLDTECNHD
jgi:hypothetical protein